MRFSAHVTLLACAALFACTRDNVIVAGSPEIEFRTADGSDYGAVDVIHLGREALDAVAQAKPTLEQWHAILPVRANDSAGTPMLGTYAIEADRIRFMPRFPPSSGTTYYAQFNAAEFAQISGARPPANARGTWSVAAIERPATTVVSAMYPTTDNVPVNLLKLYIQFSAPMSVGQSMDHIRITDDSGKPVEDAFLIPAGGEELWDPAKTRLTLLFDPGRIKRGLRPNEERGLPLQSGRRYTVFIDSTWKDANGATLAAPAKKVLRVGEADRVSPSTSSWRIGALTVGSRDPLTLRFPEALDRALLARMLTVHAPDGTEMTGTVEISDGERRWAFTPNTPWIAGTHYIDVDTDLEDLAGNSIRKLFDVAPGDSTPHITAKTVRISFTPR